MKRPPKISVFPQSMNPWFKSVIRDFHIQCWWITFWRRVLNQYFQISFACTRIKNLVHNNEIDNSTWNCATEYLRRFLPKKGWSPAAGPCFGDFKSQDELEYGREQILLHKVKWKRIFEKWPKGARLKFDGSSFGSSFWTKISPTVWGSYYGRNWAGNS